jgi:5-methylcytosine-specific restriction protein B
MQVNFWKVSHGTDYFNADEIADAIERRLVYVHMDTNPRGRSKRSQADDFIECPNGDYFYLTRGNQGILLLGQFVGPANVFSSKRDGWLDRPFRLIRTSFSSERYDGPRKQWTPNDNSTFTPVPTEEISMFQELILGPYFQLDMTQFGLSSVAA